MTKAQNIADILLETYTDAEQADDVNKRFAALKTLRPQIPVRVETPEGVVDAVFNGYQDMRAIGRGVVPNLGYTLPNGQVSHGLMKPGHKLLTPVPSPEEWFTPQPEQPGG